MSETTEQIEAHIRDTREELSGNLNELEQKVRRAASWRHHYTKSPGTFLAAAAGGGLLLALAMGGRRSAPPAAATPRSDRSPNPAKERGQLDTSIGIIKTALIGLAASKAKSVISELLPGFAAHLPPHQHPRGRTATDNGPHSDWDNPPTPRD